MKLEHFAPAAKFFIGGRAGRFFRSKKCKRRVASTVGEAKAQTEQR